MKSAFLLKQIADALGMDVEAFGQTSESGSKGKATNTERRSGEATDLFRLIAAFRAFPTEESRQQALQLLEELAGNIGDKALLRAKSEN